MAFRRKADTYYCHDDRGGGTFSGRPMAFKRYGNFKNRGARQRKDGEKLRKFLDDGDVDMSAVRPTFSRASNPRFNRIMKPRRLSHSPSSWYKVTICHGKKYARAEIIKALQNFIQPVPVLPVSVKIENEDMTFFVDNDETANELNNAHLRVQMRDGWKVQIKVRPQMPFVELNEPLKEKIKLVMSAKYDSVSQHLDLSKFHANEEFINNDLFVPLNRQNMLLAIFQIIADSVPKLRSLNLSNNKIFSTEHFSLLKRHAPDLIALDLSKNRLRNVSILNCLQGMKLEVLNLDDNPLCDEYQDHITYVREIRKLFRTLRQLDGTDLPPPVDFDIEDSVCRLPQSHDSYLCNAEGQAIVKQFLEQYYNMYDSQTGRDALADAYADSAQLSMTAFSTTNINLSRYFPVSRNLKKIQNFERRRKLLHVGKPDIVRFLNSLPKTQHDLTSFAVDLTVFTPALISLCVCGVFRETEPVPPNKTQLRSFSRTFVMIPVGGGFNIINDMLSITPASSIQIAKAFQTFPVTAPISNPQASPISLPGPSNPADAELNRKREMITALATQTGMNLMWSEKCLMETQWNFNNAILAFTQFNKEGQIPKEAFDK